jgi:hypothetical protein
MMFFFLVAPALGLPPMPERPAPPEKVQGECRVNYPISQGRLLPDGLAKSSVQASCSAVAVPLSEYADLLGTEQWCIALDKRYRIDTTILAKDNEWYKNKLALETKQKPFLERPTTQRWLGRIETLIVVGIVSASLGATYYYSSGSGK